MWISRLSARYLGKKQGHSSSKKIGATVVVEKKSKNHISRIPWQHNIQVPMLLGVWGAKEQKVSCTFVRVVVLYLGL